jgi:hypothetical protein
MRPHDRSRIDATIEQIKKDFLGLDAIRVDEEIAREVLKRNVCIKIAKGTFYISITRLGLGICELALSSKSSTQLVN